MYVTVDLDDPTRMEIVKAWHNVADATGTDPQGRLSSSRTGVHIRSHEVLPGHVPIAETIRRMCGDDVKRIEGDIDDALCHNQVLFDGKGGRDAGRWVDDLDALIGQYEREHSVPELREVYDL